MWLAGRQRSIKTARVMPDGEVLCATALALSEDLGSVLLP